jgi:choline dehydrogenase
MKNNVNISASPEPSTQAADFAQRDDAPSVMETDQWPANLGSDQDWAFHAQSNPHLNGRSILDELLEGRRKSRWQ